MADENYYTINEVCEKYKLCRKTIYNYLNAGKLEKIKIGNRTLIPETSINALIYESTNK